MASTPEITKIKVKCVHCKYEWETKSKKEYVSCPNCRRKTPAQLIIYNTVTTHPTIHGEKKPPNPRLEHLSKKYNRAHYHYVFKSHSSFKVLCVLCGKDISEEEFYIDFADSHYYSYCQKHGRKLIKRLKQEAKE